MTRGAIIPKLLLLAAPLVIGDVLQTFYNLADMYWVSQVGTEAMAAVSIVFPTAWLLISIGMGVSIATATFVAQFTGAGRMEEANLYTGQSLTLATLVGLILASLGYAFRYPLLILMGAQEAGVLDLAVSYVEVIFWSVPFSFLFFVFRAALRGVGDTVMPMILMVFSTLLNVVLDPFLILGWGPFPALGVQGAAIATFISRALVAVIGLWVLFSGSREITVRPKHLKPDLPIIRRIVLLGAPATLDGAARSTSAVTMVGIIARFGATATAAYGVGIRFMSIIWTLSGAVGQAANTGVGQNLGSRQPERADKIAWSATLLDFGALLAVGALVAYFAPAIIGFFSDDPAVVAAGTQFLRIVSWSFSFAGSLMVIQGALQGAGRTGTAMTISIASRWGLRIPLAIVMSTVLGFGVVGIWWAMFTADVISSLAGAWVLKLGHWKKAVINQA